MEMGWTGWWVGWWTGWWTGREGGEGREDSSQLEEGVNTLEKLQREVHLHIQQLSPCSDREVREGEKVKKVGKVGKVGKVLSITSSNSSNRVQDRRGDRQSLPSIYVNGLTGKEVCGQDGGTQIQLKL